jgi:hypothetical protein
VRNGFVPESRRQVFERLRPLIAPECPFVNLPETHRSRWGEGLTAEDMMFADQSGTIETQRMTGHREFGVS